MTIDPSSSQAIPEAFIPKAAALTSHLPVVSIVSPAAAQQFSAPAGLPVNISATQADAFIANITATGSEGTVLESSDSPLNASWGPLAAGHYSLAAAASDTAGLSGVANPIEIDVIGQGGSLSIEEVAPSSTIDLESQGSADWLLWGPLNTGDTITDNPGHLLARKPGVAPLIAEYKPIGNHPIGSAAFAHDLCFTANQQNYCGSDIAVHGRGNGFEINVAADTTPRTLQLYVGTQSADGNIIAFLSDGSAPVATEIGGSGGTPNPGNTTLYNIQFAAASPGQALTVRFTLNSDQGRGQIELIGATLSGSPIAPSVPAPQITSVTPGSAPLDARITINGTNFGANQEAGYVQIGVQAQIVSWSDTAIVAIVPAALQVGSTVEVTVFTDHGVSNTATLNILSYNIFPASINLLVGQSRTLAARDNHGNPVTGLPWSTSDPTIIGLSADDPPLVVALAPGSAKIWAGDISVPVTVYAGAVLPAGTPVWTLPVPGDPNKMSLVPAVPSSNGADVLALDELGTLTAISADGFPVWKVSGIPGGLSSNVIPDFAGGTFLKTPYTYSDAQGDFHSTHKIQRADQTMGLLVDLYTYTDKQTIPHNFDDASSVQAAIPHTGGMLFIQDNATVSVTDPSGVRSQVNVTADDSTRNGTNVPPIMGRMIVAGDGNAYVPYVFSEEAITFPDPSTTTRHLITHAMVLRVAPDGTSAKTILRSWTFNSTCVPWTPPGHTSADGQQCTTSGPTPSITNNSVITNADQGVAVFETHVLVGCAQEFYAVIGIFDHGTGCGDTLAHTEITYIAQDTVTTQIPDAAIFSNDSGRTEAFVPSLQREDGSYIGTDTTSVFFGYNNLMAIGASGGVLWKTPITSAPTFITPQYAIAGGGVLVQSKQVQNCQSNPPQCQTMGSPVQYTLDQNGIVIGQQPDLGIVYSWKGAYRRGSVEAVSFPIPPLAATWAAVPPSTGNLTGNGASMVHHTLGLFFCGLSLGEAGRCLGDGRPDIMWGYYPASTPTSQIPSIVKDFSVDHRDWVAIILTEAVETFKSAFAKHAIIVTTGTVKPGNCGERAMICEDVQQQQYAVYVVGGFDYPGTGKSFPTTTSSNVYFFATLVGAQEALGKPSAGAGWDTLNLSYPPTGQTSAKFIVL